MFCRSMPLRNSWAAVGPGGIPCGKGIGALLWDWPKYKLGAPSAAGGIHHPGLPPPTPRGIHTIGRAMPMGGAAGAAGAGAWAVGAAAATSGADSRTGALFRFFGRPSAGLFAAMISPMVPTGRATLGIAGTLGGRSTRGSARALGTLAALDTMGSITLRNIKQHHLQGWVGDEHRQRHRQECRTAPPAGLSSG